MPLTINPRYRSIGTVPVGSLRGGLSPRMGWDRTMQMDPMGRNNVTATPPAPTPGSIQPAIPPVVTPGSLRQRPLQVNASPAEQDLAPETQSMIAAERVDMRTGAPRVVTAATEFAPRPGTNATAVASVPQGYAPEQAFMARQAEQDRYVASLRRPGVNQDQRVNDAVAVAARTGPDLNQAANRLTPAQMTRNEQGALANLTPGGMTRNMASLRMADYQRGRANTQADADAARGETRAQADATRRIAEIGAMGKAGMEQGPGGSLRRQTPVNDQDEVVTVSQPVLVDPNDPASGYMKDKNGKVQMEQVAVLKSDLQRQAAEGGAAPGVDDSISQAEYNEMESAMKAGSFNVGKYRGDDLKAIEKLQSLRRRVRQEQEPPSPAPSPASGAPAAAPTGDIPTVSTPEDARKLPKGSRFRTPDGKVMIVP